MGALVGKAILTSLIVGFVTASIKSYIDRIFLVLLMLFILKLPITQAILINLLVMSLASYFFYARHEGKLRALPRGHLWGIALLAGAGAIAGRLVALAVGAKVLAALLGLYAIGVGLRLLLVKLAPPSMQREPGPAIYPLAFGWAAVTGLVSAGGKPFQVPIMVRWLKLNPNQAYILASLVTLSATIGAVLTQLVVAPQAFAGAVAGWALYFFASITVVALVVERFWTPKLQQVVSYIIGPLLILAGLRLGMTILR